MSFGFDIEQANAEALAYVRKESLDIFNRLHSIAEDVHFVGEVHQAYPELPFLPNLRCGAWYLNPKIASQAAAYFKSTDGHFGNWSFNLRRPNLHLLPLIAAEGGLVLVDSTRAGKRIPDALSKTVPIWCAVINRAMLLVYPEKAKEEGWDVELYCPAGAVSEQERSQMKARLDGWARDLSRSSYCLPYLSRPLRPLWITPSTSVFPNLHSLDKLKYSPIVCVSASKQVGEGVERRSHGFSYVQGSGDDHELWGMGLTPQLFWEHMDTLLTSDREDLPCVVAKVIAESKVFHKSDVWTTLPTPIGAVQGRVLIGAVPDMPCKLSPTIPHVDGAVSFVVVSANVSPGSETDSDTTDHAPEEAHVLRLRLAEGKKDQLHFLQHVLPTSTRYIKDRLAMGDAICVCCDSGRDAGVGIALAAIQLFFDGEGKAVEPGLQAGSPSKESIRTRLQWIIASRPAANPSRVTLKRVNEFLLSSPAFRRR
ncbi:initiator tRNA phosphoribosyl transferase [Lentinus tigrinus ALCF2SS1-7]|uniref:Initiator tRNA phosphoribosyl transferase n=1 Tax=Lentinus tigrinus ALCF2SS1-6 TaxID=1328759 RepID=A0A5C2S2K3_9APHY|nr:initiator tRNA phosphoribosyl transferase [Lentinus tigrinus ALCF2SS1-6]RPD71957.1 initiator tRNA phosphoribosyl transferase [Lentinus tigrinus ALCF2SS1-7]